MVDIWNTDMSTLEIVSTRFMNSERELFNKSIKHKTYEKLFIESKMVAVLPLYEKGFSRFFHWFVILETVGVFWTGWWGWVRFSWGDGEGWFSWFVVKLGLVFVVWLDRFRSGNLLPLLVFRGWFGSFSFSWSWFGSAFGGFTLFWAAYLRRFTLIMRLRRQHDFRNTFHLLVVLQLQWRALRQLMLWL